MLIDGYAQTFLGKPAAIAPAITAERFRISVHRIGTQ